MRPLGILIGVVLSGSVCAWSAETSTPPFFGTERASAVLQNPVGAIGGVASAVNTLQPSVEEFYDLHHSHFFTGSTVALWTFSSKQVPIASLRAGYGANAKVVGELKVDVQGVAQRYLLPSVPTQAKTVFTAGVLHDAWGVAGKYGHVALFVGYDVEHHDNSDKLGGGLYGVSVGGSF